MGILSPHTSSWNHGIVWLGKCHKYDLVPPTRPGCSNMFQSFVLGWFGDFFFKFYFWFEAENLRWWKKNPKHPKPSVSQILPSSMPVQIAGVPGTSFWKQFKGSGLKICKTTLKAGSQAFLEIEELGETQFQRLAVFNISFRSLSCAPEWQNLLPKTAVWLQLG